MESSIHLTPRPRTRNLRKHVPEIYPAFNRDVLQQPGLQPPPGNKLGILSLQLLRPSCQQSESVQEGTEDLSPKIKTLQANSEIIQQFHNAEDLHSISLIQPLIQNIIRSEIDFHQSVHGIQTPKSCQCPTSCLHVLVPRPVCEQVGKELLIEPFSF